MLLLALGGVVLGFAFLLVSLVTDNAAWAWACIAVCVLAGIVLVADVVRRRRVPTADGVAAAPQAPDEPAADPVAEPDGSDHQPVEPAAGDDPEPADGTGPAEDHTVVLRKAEPAEPAEPESVVPEPTEPVTPARVGDEPTEVISGARAAGRPDPAVVDAPTQHIPVVRTPEDEISPADLLTAAPAAAALPDPGTEPDVEPGSDAAQVASSDAEVVVVDERPRFHLRSCAWLGARPVIALPAREAVDLGFSPCAVCRPVAALGAAAPR